MPSARAATSSSPRGIDGVFTLHGSTLGKHGWSDPVPLDVYGGKRALAVDMAYAPDGDVVYFLGGVEHGLFEEQGQERFDLWMIERTAT